MIVRYLNSFVTIDDADYSYYERIGYTEYKKETNTDNKGVSTDTPISKPKATRKRTTKKEA